MALVPFTITAIERDVADAVASGKQVIVGAVCSLFLQPSDVVAQLYDNANSDNGNTAKVTNANGQVTVWVEPGDYRVSVNSNNSFVSLQSGGNIVTESITETQTLAALQTTVTLASLSTTRTAFYINGAGVDNGRLVLGVDFTLTSTATIELTTAYPDGTLITAVQNDGTEALFSAVKVFDNIAEMNGDTSLVADDYVICKKYYSDGELVDGLEFNIVAGGAGTDDGGSFHDLDNGLQAQLVDSPYLDLRVFGGISEAGESDLATANINSAALRNAVVYKSGGVNSTANDTSNSGTVIIQGGSWTFNTVDLTLRWGWNIDADNAKIFFNDEWQLNGSAFFTLKLGYCQPTVSKFFGVDGIIMFKSLSPSERVHNFDISFKEMAGFRRAFYAGESWSQGTIRGGQFDNNTKSFESASGGENVVLRDFIFANHVTQTEAIVSLSVINPILQNWQFETNPDNGRPDVQILAAQGLVMNNTRMVTSGGIRVDAGEVKITNSRISNCRSTDVISNVAGQEVDVDGNRISWDVNNGTGTAFSDGTGKTAIKTLAPLRSCVGNTIRRPDNGIYTLSASLQSLDSNNIIDPKTNAYLLQGADKVKINGGSVALGTVGSKGVTVTGTNGNNNVFSRISFGDSLYPDRYNLSSGNGQNSVVIDSGVGDPEGLGVIAGSGSTFNVIGAGGGASLYVKSSSTGALDWRPVGTLERTTVQLTAATDFSNTTGKHRGRTVYNTSTNQILFATGGTAVSPWADADGVTVITPV